MGWLTSVASELPIAISDTTLWLSIGQALIFAGLCLLVGIGVARVVGLLERDAPAGEVVGVGLATGLLVVAALWAAIASGGRSSFTPVAVGFAIAVGLSVARSLRQTRDTTGEADEAATRESASSRLVRLLPACLAGALFIAAVALLYGSTIVLSPRDGVQPVDFADSAYYSVLGSDLARTGIETAYAPSGFSEIQGVPAQTWYHWGEMWLQAAVITIFGSDPLDARHFIVLPVLLLASAALTGTLVRRLTGSVTRGAFLFGFLACLFLAPVAIPGPYFSSRAVGLIFGITTYGLAAVAVLLSMYALAVLDGRRASWALAVFVGSAAALVVPAHIAIAVLGLVGVGSAAAVRIIRSLAATRRLPVVTTTWRRTFIAAGVAIVATVAWGQLTGHGMLGGGSSPSVAAFDASWRDSIALIALGSGAMAAIVIAWFLDRKEASLRGDMYVGTMALLVTGAIYWGSQLADFNSFHVFFAGIVIFATPVAAVAVWSIWLRLRATGHTRLAVGLLVLCVLQIEFGLALGVVKLVSFGPGKYEPVSVAVLDAIRDLPPDAKVAYACVPFEEDGFWYPSLGALRAHTGRDVVPMCFQAETFPRLTGATISQDVPSPFFERAPQRTLYPTSTAVPAAQDVATFLRDNRIGYIYEDTLHPNTLVPGAVPIFESGETRLLRIP